MRAPRTVRVMCDVCATPDSVTRPRRRRCLPRRRQRPAVSHADGQLSHAYWASSAEPQATRGLFVQVLHFQWKTSTACMRSGSPCPFLHACSCE